MVPFTLHGLTKVSVHIHRMEITKRLYITACITQIYIRLLTAWVNKTVPPAMHGLVKFSINFLLHPPSPCTPHELPKLLRLHRTEYKRAIYTAGLPKVNFNLHRMEITEPLHITFRVHRTNYRNCSVYTARNTIEPFTPHGLPKVNFHLHRMEITKLLHITFRFHRTDY